MNLYTQFKKDKLVPSFAQSIGNAIPSVFSLPWAYLNENLDDDKKSYRLVTVQLKSKKWN